MTRGLSYFGVMSLAESLVAVVSYFVALRMLIQQFGLEAAGLWSLTMGFVTLIRVLDLTGAAGLARMVALAGDNRRKAAEYIDTLSMIVLVVYTTFVVVTFVPLQSLLVSFVEPQMQDAGRALFAIAMVALPINLVSSAQLSAVDGIGRADIRAIINQVSMVLFLVLTWFLLPRYGVVGMAFAQIAQHVTALVASRVFLARSLPPLRLVPMAFSKAAAKETLTFGAKLQLSAIPMAIFDPVTRILLGRMAGLEFLAQYDIAYKLAAYTRNLVRSYLTPMLPQFSKMSMSDVEAGRRLLTETSVAIARVVSLLFTGLIAASPLFSLFMLSTISAEFILFTAVLSLGWGLTTLWLVTQLYARAFNVLRWSIIGQWGMLALAVPLISATSNYLGDIYLPMALAGLVLIGHLLAFVGEVRTLKLTPFDSSRSSLPWIAGFAGFAVIVILVTLTQIEV
ncbi:MAG: oligosaccharide flippase family protein [Roseicyclus sp.]|nr:oligosaccharide flippase family protein [Roseicyclus sp.]